MAFIITISDLEKARATPDFVLDVVKKWQSSTEYNAMLTAQKYFLGENPALQRRWATIQTEAGSFKMKPKQLVSSDIFKRAIMQYINRLLHYDVSFENVGNAIETSKDFNGALLEITYDAAVCGVSYGFWDYSGRVVQIPAMQGIPIVDDTTGDVVKFIYFWQLAADRPTSYQLFEIDGVTTWSKSGRDTRLTQTQEKVPYRFKQFKWNSGQTALSSTQNYSRLPIVAMHANNEKRSELTNPIKSKINVLDLLMTFYSNEFLDSKFLYWLINDYGGNLEELIKIKETVQKLGIIANQSDTGSIIPQTLSLPHEAFEAMVERLEAQIFNDLMTFNPTALAGSTNIATAIRAGQYPEDAKISGLQRKVEKFIMEIANIAGIDTGKPSFKHYRLFDEASVSTRLQGWADRGVPIKTLTRLEPLFADNYEEINDEIDREMMGYEPDEV